MTSLTAQTLDHESRNCGGRRTDASIHIHIYICIATFSNIFSDENIYKIQKYHKAAWWMARIIQYQTHKLANSEI